MDGIFGSLFFVCGFFGVMNPHSLRDLFSCGVERLCDRRGTAFCGSVVGILRVDGILGRLVFLFADFLGDEPAFVARLVFLRVGAAVRPPRNCVPRLRDGILRVDWIFVRLFFCLRIFLVMNLHSLGSRFSSLRL